MGVRQILGRKILQKILKRMKYFLKAHSTWEKRGNQINRSVWENEKVLFLLRKICVLSVVCVIGGDV